AEVAQQPPEPLRATHVPVRHDEDAAPDPGSRGRASEVLGSGKRMTTARPRRRGEILVHVEERRTRNVPGEVELAPLPGRAELPATVDELIAHDRTLLPRWEVMARELARAMTVSRASRQRVHLDLR